MILYHIRDLMMQKSRFTKTKVTYQTIEQATGISKVTLSRLASEDGYNTTMKNIEKLCFYFDCEIQQLVSIKKGG